MTPKRLTQEITHYFNVIDYISSYKLAQYLSMQHRYLVNEIYKGIILFLIRLAKNYEDKRYDDRNRTACEQSSLIIKTLKDNDLLTDHQVKQYIEELDNVAYEYSYDE